MMPRVVYEKFVKGYSEKQWGVPADRAVGEPRASASTCAKTTSRG